MIRRPLGRTGLSVGVVSLGTAELGLDYGFAADAGRRRPSRPESIRLIEKALDLGVDLIDTAPAYGDAEGLVGEVVAASGRALVATKVRAIPPTAQPHRDADLRRHVRESVRASLASLRTTSIDVLQVHNASAELVRQGQIGSILAALRDEGDIRFAGATTYAVEDTQAVLEDGRFDIVQVPLNMLDRRHLAILPAADAAGVGVIARSVLMRGVLTDRRAHLPDALDDLRSAADALGAIASEMNEREGLTSLAFRYALSSSVVASALIGTSRMDELEGAVTAAERGPVPAGDIDRLHRAPLPPAWMLDPRMWPDNA